MTQAIASTTPFWLKRESVPLTLDTVSALNDEQARHFLAELRWSKDQQVCPDCGAIDRHHNIRTRKQWRCRHWVRTFSVTAGTPFADHKIGYRKLLLAIFAFVIHQKGLSALTFQNGAEPTHGSLDLLPCGGFLLLNSLQSLAR